jgi:hypothetical protein
MGRHKSPNIGLTVTIKHRQFGAHGGDHSEYGPVYRCEGPGLTQMADSGAHIITGWADIPGNWLRRIEPDRKVKTKEASYERT